MWVLDASAAAELLLSTSQGRVVARIVGDGDLYAPQHMAVEVLSVLRGLVRGGLVDEPRAEGALADLRDLGVLWMDVPPLMPRSWDLRHNISAYDAAYVALAEAIECHVLTCDSRLARASQVCVVPERA